MGSPVYHAMMLVSGPAIAMIFLALAVMIADPPVLFVAAMQHLVKSAARDLVRARRSVDVNAETRRA